MYVPKGYQLNRNDILGDLHTCRLTMHLPHCLFRFNVVFFIFSFIKTLFTGERKREEERVEQLGQEQRDKQAPC